jgi:hypothetical protein
LVTLEGEVGFVLASTGLAGFTPSCV